MELRQLRYFVAVAEERHFGRAAARLHLAQPALSQQIRNLERDVGAQLIERSSRPVGLTPAGEAVLAEARRTLSQVELAIERTRRAGSGKSGHLTIGFLGSVGRDLLPKVMTEFNRKRPAVTLELHEIIFHEQQAAFRDGRLDVGFMRLPVDDPALDTAPVYDDPAVALLAEGHPLADAGSLALSDLAGEPWVLAARASWPAGWDWWESLWRAQGLTPDVAATATSLEVLVGLVATGRGVSFLPETARALPRDGVVTVPLDGITSTAAVAWPRERGGVLVREFVDTTLRVARDGAPHPATSAR